MRSSLPLERIKFTSIVTILLILVCSCKIYHELKMSLPPFPSDLCQPVKRVRTEPQMRKHSGAEACQDRRNTRIHTHEKMQRITVKHETPPDKGSDSLIHVCPEAQAHAEQGNLNEGLQGTSHCNTRIGLQTQPSKQIQFCVHSNALHQCDIINTTGVTENSDTISLCFFLLLQTCVRLPEQG